MLKLLLALARSGGFRQMPIALTPRRLSAAFGRHRLGGNGEHGARRSTVSRPCGRHRRRAVVDAIPAAILQLMILELRHRHGVGTFARCGILLTWGY